MPAGRMFVRGPNSALMSQYLVLHMVVVTEVSVTDAVINTP